ncbi:FMN-binding protein [Prevotella sp. OH937_COT-195]|uniref:FMN-binding protein n=1 Tax=Prevotella sp. OH937_COT-195 TaxID=2491051 RepID=UPI000F646554|nr:FMN-binding protein [Prevotella sp. OH937_COT-195]RRC98727.1 FMN-binding protein [Prevotella sp. OH937_COT-195]
MKKKVMNMAMAAAVLLSSATVMQNVRAAASQDKVMTKMADGTFVVNTTSLAKDVKGYKGTTPLNIHIKNGKVVKVEALGNMETPKYFAIVKTKIMTKWDGQTISKARKMEVDTKTGATYSSKSVVENVRRGLDYYNAHK